MSLGASEYSVGCAQNTQKYIQNLLKKEAVFGQNRALVIEDLCRKTDRFTFSSKPGKRQMTALLEKFGR